MGFAPCTAASPTLERKEPPIQATALEHPSKSTVLPKVTLEKVALERPPRNRLAARWETPRLRVLPRLQATPPEHTAPSPAGLIVITGPPLSGKASLGHYLSEYLPDSVHVSQTDPVIAELRDEDPEPLNALLRNIRSQLRCGHKVVFSARLPNAKMRRRVVALAREMGVPSLLVEVEGTDPAALERATEIAETLAEIRDLLAELKQHLPSYQTVNEREQVRVPTLTVPAEEPVEEQIKAVLDGWGKLGAVH